MPLWIPPDGPDYISAGVGSAISENDRNTFLFHLPGPTLNRAPRHLLPDMTFTRSTLPACQRRRGPGPAAAVHIAPAAALLAWLGLVLLGLSLQKTCSDESGELSPSFCTVTSERISDAQSAFTNTADAGTADTNRSLRPRVQPALRTAAVTLPAYCNTGGSYVPTVRRWCRCESLLSHQGTPERDQRYPTSPHFLPLSSSFPKANVKETEEEHRSFNN